MEVQVAQTAQEALSEMEQRLDGRFAKLESMILSAEHVATESALWTHPRRKRGSDQLLQHLARLEWRRLAALGGSMPTFDDVQCRFFSQNGEDGIIWYLLSLIGDGAKRVVEICSGDGVECCSANLIVNHGWQALLFEGNSDLVDRGRQFYEHCGDAWFSPPRFVNTWVTPDNVNAHLAEHGFGSDVDVVIIDMDGNDYWMWEALELDPRLVVVEIQSSARNRALNCDSLSPRFSMARRFGVPQCFSAGIRQIGQPPRLSPRGNRTLLLQRILLAQ